MDHIVVWSYDEEPPVKTSATYGLVLFQKHVSYELQTLIEALSDQHALLASYKDSYIYLFIRMDALQSTPLPLATEAPFAEARYFIWLSRLHPENIEYMQLHSTSRLSKTKASREKALLCKKYIEPSLIQNDDPSISIMIASYNAERFISSCLRSIAEQSVSVEQTVLVDDASTDNTVALVQQTNLPTLTTHQLPVNVGKSKALNQVIPFITSEWVLELDADDWLDPNAIATIKTLINTTSIKEGLLYGNFRHWKQEQKTVTFKKIAKGRAVRNQQDLLRYPFPLGPRLYHTSSLQALGGYPASSFHDGRLFEDVLLLREWLNHYPFHYADFTVYNVRKHDESITKKNHSKWNDFLRYL
ncbi:glycosyltransferase family 2 protein [Geomicrobium sediminis]|uniref:Glycosyltransferase 2-like domain-containing protein n=1 Tax=Geomicrobium sediminis TaxID=1347788 RepID=A0ABS2PB26_9BACL|nr:glycosyltransferase family 2 protein [Geomicrobium sediminis]MBM7632196.1 hypothetical protein [Geomicrobium sediminis]